MKRRTALWIALILACSSGTALGQKKPKEEEAAVRSVEGVVTDPEGNLVEGAVVQLKNTRTLQVRSFITRKDGAYFFHGLSTNVDYELKAEHQGRSSDVRTLSVFDSRRKAVINLRLKNP
jgi:hypothetical protein